MSSSVWAGLYSLKKAYDLADVTDPSATMQSELQRIGYLGDLECSHKAFPLAAHFELHIGKLQSVSFHTILTISIEQGPILESSGAKIGVVEGGQAYRW